MSKPYDTFCRLFTLAFATGSFPDGERKPSLIGIDCLMCRHAKFRPLASHGTPSGIVSFRTVVIHENSVVAAITKEGAAEFSDIRRCFHPARRFRLEISKFLQLSILFFR